MSCKSIYKTSEFSLDEVPPEPDYSNETSWAVLPNKWNTALRETVGESKIKEADVFFIYPTLFADKNN